MITFCVQWSKTILFKLAAISKASSWCMIEGTNEYEYTLLIDIGDIIIEQNSGGNSTDVWLDSAKKKHVKFITQQEVSMKTRMGSNGQNLNTDTIKKISNFNSFLWKTDMNCPIYSFWFHTWNVMQHCSLL